ncbi:MAG: protease pro-enzyme activation domain-containing protein [Nitrososphaeria archaeon]
MNCKVLLIILIATFPLGTLSLTSHATSNQAIPATVAALPGYKQTGSLPANYPLLVTVYVPLKNTGLLYSMVKEISNPYSSQYQHFLTYSQIKKLFLPVDQYSQVINYLKDKGFKVVLTAMDSAILVQGTVQQIKQYLGLSTLLYTNGTYSYYTLVGTPSINAIVYASNVTGLILRHPDTLITEKTLQGLIQKMQPNMTFPIAGISAKELWKAYNVTGLLNSGISGSGYTIGILDWYGDPYINQVLQVYDREFGFPNPPNFTVVPIGPYDPNLGVLTGWDGEISGDVELSHSMAPSANITLYIGNGALPVFVPISFIDQQHAVQTVSQSWSIYEWYYSVLGPAFYITNLQLADYYYALGSLEGITFIASTGDAGGSGYSAGTLGTPGYPSTSPFVTAVGGTTVYVSGNSTLQTAWSNYGFIPFFVNYGGSTGGVSMLEPLPWYQSALTVPLSYPYGRMVPDISLSASPFPGTWTVFSGNVTGIFGGTSEASPLLAGLLTLVMQKVHHPLGLINTFLYQKGYLTGSVEQVTFGYSIPWTAHSGYNLVTGLGYPNIGVLAQVISSSTAVNNINITVALLNSSLMTQPNNEFQPGSTIVVLANASSDGLAITTGSFMASLESLQGILSSVQMQYNATLKLWIGKITVPSTGNGPAYINVQGSSSGLTGEGMAETYLGYFVTYLNLLTPYPVLLMPGTSVFVQLTDLSGQPAPIKGNYYISTYYYNFMKNTYIPIETIPLIPVNSTYGIWEGTTNATYQNGPVLLQGVGAFGYLPVMNGVDLQTMFILPETVIEPGAGSPGNYIIVQGNPLPPYSLLSYFSAATGYPIFENVMYGSNITAELISPSGKVISTANIPFNGMYYNGYLKVPENAQPGLYSVVLNSFYESYTLGLNITGSYYGQILISPSTVPKITVTGEKFEGGNLNIYANITYQNGTEVKYGIFVAAVYSNDAQSGYGMYLFSGVPLSYSQSMNEWVGRVSLPNPYSPFQYNATTGTVFMGPQGYSGPFDVYVSGTTWNGVPTTSSLSAQKQFFISPQYFVSGKILGHPLQTNNLALKNDTLIVSNSTLSDDVFLGGNTLKVKGNAVFSGVQFYNKNYIKGGTVMITTSSISGTLYLINTNATLESVKAGSVYAINSSVKLVDSSVNYMNLQSSKLSGSSYSVSSISPSPPSIKIQYPRSDISYSSSVPVEINITGENIQAVNVYVDGSLVKSFTAPGVYSFNLSASSYPDGTHTLSVTALQSDGISSQASVQFETTYQLQTVSQQASAEISSLNTTLISVKETLSASVAEYFITSLIIGILAILLAIYAIMKRSGRY